MVPAGAVLVGLARIGSWGRPEGATRDRLASGRLDDLSRRMVALATCLEANWNDAPDEVKTFLTALAYARPRQLPLRLRVAGFLETLHLMIALARRRADVLAYLEARSRLDEAVWTALEHENEDWAADAGTSPRAS